MKEAAENEKIRRLGDVNMTTEKDALTVSQSLEIAHLRKILTYSYELSSKIYGGMYNIGAPLNDNCIKMNREQQQYLYKSVGTPVENLVHLLHPYEENNMTTEKLESNTDAYNKIDDGEFEIVLVTGPSNYYGTLTLGKHDGAFYLILKNYNGYDSIKISDKLAKAFINELTDPNPKE